MDHYTHVYSYTEFKKRIEEYHDFDSPSDILTYNWIYNCIHINKRYNFLSMDGMRLIVEGYLADWGGMRRWLLWGEGSDSLENVSEKILTVLNSPSQKVQKIAAFDLWNCLEDAIPDLKILFNDLSSIKLGHKFKKSSRLDNFGVVATGKLLHMLFPNLCIIWDNKYVLDKKFGEHYFDRNGNGYCEYLRAKRIEMEAILTSFGGVNTENAIDKIQQEHSEFLRKYGFENIREPITKLLDECNY